MDGAVDQDDLFSGLAMAVSHHLRLLQLARRVCSCERWRRRHRRSVRGRAPNKRRDFNLGLRNSLLDYWGVDSEPPVFDEADFERRFRMPRAVFMLIYKDIKDEPFFRQRVNDTGRTQAHPLQKFVAALRVPSNGEAADRPDEYVRLSNSTSNSAVKNFIEFFVNKYESTYLRAPTDENITRILAFNKDWGLPAVSTAWNAAIGSGMAARSRRRDSTRAGRASDRLSWRRFATTTSGFSTSLPARQEATTTSTSSSRALYFFVSCAASGRHVTFLLK